MVPAFSPLLSVADADRLLDEASQDFAAGWGGERPAEVVPLAAAAGRVSGEDIRADRAYPAQDRSRMDGIALSGEGLAALASGCPVAGLARAGDARLDAPPRGGCVEIMTGAALPHGCDTVVPYEDIVFEESAVVASESTGGISNEGAADPAVDSASDRASAFGSTVAFDTVVDAAPPPARVARLRAGAAARAGQHVHRAGSDCAAGAVLVPAGARLNAAHVAIAASVGLATLRVARPPRVAVVATGDELVGVDETPLPHQLRVSNAHGLAALLAPWTGAENVRVHRVGDDPAALHAVLRAVLSSFDLVLVSGGVSAGKFDLVPDTLAALGVRKVFHKLAQKPGKPLWFGVCGLSGVGETPEGLHDTPTDAGLTSSGSHPEERSSASVSAPNDAVAVFGLPGNPVSALVCARRYVLPLIWRRMGWVAPPASYPLAAPVTEGSRLTRFLPVRLVRRQVSAPGAGEVSGLETVAEACTINGSGDFATLGVSDGFVELPPSEKSYPAGAQMAFFGWSS